jgi:hypothetical protein
MDDAITILAGILAALVMIKIAWSIYVDSESGRMPFFDTLDMLLFVVSIAVLLIIAKELSHTYWP